MSVLCPSGADSKKDHGFHGFRFASPVATVLRPFGAMSRDVRGPIDTSVKLKFRRRAPHYRSGRAFSWSIYRVYSVTRP